MIVLMVRLEQSGEFMATSYHADDSDGTGTPAERARVEQVVALIQKDIVDRGGTGTFTVRKPESGA